MSLRPEFGSIKQFNGAIRLIHEKIMELDAILGFRKEALRVVDEQLDAERVLSPTVPQPDPPPGQ